MYMNKIDFCKLRRDLDDAITYADFDLAWQIAKQGLDCAHDQELMGEMMYFKAQQEIISEKYEDAINFLNLAIKYNPLDGAAYNDRALCFIELGKGENQILADFDKGIEVEPDYATIYHNKGWYLNKLGRHKEAITYFEETLNIEPERAVTYENLADAYLNLGLKHEAVDSLKKALKCLDPIYTDIKDQLEKRIKALTDADSK